jgi:hypothetical protein
MTSAVAPDVAPRTARLALAGIVATALVLRWPGMTESLWFDEYYMSNCTVGSLALLLKSTYSDVHPPLYYALMWLWNDVFGDSERSLRTPPLLCGLGSLVLLYALASQWLDRRAGLCAALLLALAPVHVWYSTEARPYSAQMFLVLLSTLAFVKLCRPGAGRGLVVLFCLSLLALVFTHFYMAVYAVAFGVLALATRMERRRAVAICCIVALALMACYATFKVLTSELATEKSYLRSFGLAEAWSLFYDWFLYGHALTPDGATVLVDARRALLVGLQVLAVLATVLGVVRIFRVPANAAHPPGWHALALLACLPAFLALLPLLGRERTYIERTMLPALPLFVLVLAAGLTWPRQAWLRRVLTAIVAAGLATADVAVLTERDLVSVYFPNPDWRSAAGYLSSEIDAGGAGRPVYTQVVSPDVLGYYDPRIQQERTFSTDDKRMDRLLAAIERTLGKDGPPGSWLYAFAQGMNREFEEQKERLRAGMRMRVRDLDRHDPRTVPAAERADGAFYVLWLGNYEDARADELARDPALHLVETREWRWCRLYKLRYRTG